ncbi:hypothetical protein, partial [Marinitoga arctica]
DKMKKGVFILFFSFLILFIGCTQLTSLKTYYIEGYFKDDWGDGQLHPWGGKFAVLALNKSGEMEGYDIANDQETTDDYFKIENLPQGEYTLIVYTEANNNIDDNNIKLLLENTPDATKHIILTKNVNITILFGEND